MAQHIGDVLATLKSERDAALSECARLKAEVERLTQRVAEDNAVCLCEAREIVHDLVLLWNGHGNGNALDRGRAFIARTSKGEAQEPEGGDRG